MSTFKIGGGTSEDQLQQFFAYQFAQSSTGIATTGVLTGLSVAQTTTASAAVLVDIGMALTQASLTAGADALLNNAQITLDVLTANPLGALKRNDLVVFDPADSTVKLVVGTPNATPTNPTPPTGSVLLAELDHDPAVSTTTVPTSRIVDRRTITYPFNGPFAKVTTAEVGKRVHRFKVSVTPNGTGYATVTHGCGFTPTVVVGTAEFAYGVGIDTIGGTTFQVRLLNPVTSGAASGATNVMFICWE